MKQLERLNNQKKGLLYCVDVLESIQYDNALILRKMEAEARAKGGVRDEEGNKFTILKAVVGEEFAEEFDRIWQQNIRMDKTKNRSKSLIESTDKSIEKLNKKEELDPYTKALYEEKELAQKSWEASQEKIGEQIPIISGDIIEKKDSFLESFISRPYILIVDFIASAGMTTGLYYLQIEFLPLTSLLEAAAVWGGLMTITTLISLGIYYLATKENLKDESVSLIH